MHKNTAKLKKRASSIGKSLVRGTKLVNITRNITVVRIMLWRNLDLLPTPLGIRMYKRLMKAIAKPGIITVTVMVDP